MNILESLLLGVFQGITEFLPISSSGHLILAEHFLGLDASTLLPFDALLHGGTLVSLMWLFWREIMQLTKTTLMPHKASKKERQLLLFIVIAALPTALVGLMFKDQIEMMRSPFSVAILFIVTGVMFLMVETFLTSQHDKITYKNAFAVATLQILSLLGGVSRSGTCTAAAMATGLRREVATRFAFLVGLPILGGATLISMLDVWQGNATLPALLPSMIAFITSAVVGYFVAKYLLEFFKKYTLRPFGVYLIGAGMMTLLIL